MSDQLTPFIFRVIRERIDGETIKVTLEPFSESQILHPSEGDEFITGFLNSRGASNLWIGE